MDDSIEENLEQTLFERNAGKCNSREARIEFCKSYLQKHGGVSKVETGLQYEVMDAGNTFKGMTVSRPGSDREFSEVTTFYIKKEFDSHVMQFNPIGEHDIKMELAHGLINGLVNHNHIQFTTQQNYRLDRTEVVAKIKVAIGDKK